MPNPATRERARFRFAPHVERVEGARGDLELSEALSRLRRKPFPILFDSASGSPCAFSLLAFDPLPPLVTNALPRNATLGDLRACIERLERVPTSARSERGEPPFFGGGFLGALSYDLGVDGERLDLPRDPWGLPKMVGGLYVDYLVRDHSSGETWLVLGADPGDDRPGVEERRTEILDALSAPFGAARRGSRSSESARAGAATRLVPPDEYRRHVERVRDEIARGEIYQANVSYRMTRELDADPVDLYLALRERHAGPYLGYVSFEHDGRPGALLSGSPELLLDYSPPRAGRDAIARTRPIKGTAARGATPADDRASAAALLASEKDRAELSMIVDLERNDLGRVALPGGVSVGEFPRLESYATVHHLVADVTARVDPAYDGIDVLAALFPGGSVTGAPKLRSMEIIAALEGEGRGFAYGSMLMADARGRVLANILIRTLIWRGDPGEVTYRVGGGITWPSDPAAEEAETLAKGLALAAALDSLSDGTSGQVE